MLRLYILPTLPFTTLQGGVLKDYIRQGNDYMACCAAHKIAALPVSYNNLALYFLNYFSRGHTSRTFPTITTRLKWYVQNILKAEWLDTLDPRAYDALSRAKRAMSKLDESVVKKARPLYQAVLRLAAKHASSGLFDIMLVALWTLAQAAIQHLGEVTGGVARVKNLKLYNSPRGRFFGFHYLSTSRPKAHKTKQAPFAMISLKSNPFAFKTLQTFMRVFHSKSPDSAILFPSVSMKGNIARAHGVSASSAISGLQRLLKKAGIPNPSAYTGHSARRGGLVDRIMTVPMALIEQQGHWSPGSLTASREYDVLSVERRIEFF